MYDILKNIGGGSGLSIETEQVILTSTSVVCLNKCYNLILHTGDEVKPGIKISKQGYDVKNMQKTPTKANKKAGMTLPYMLSSLAMPYLQGAEVTLKRYTNASQLVKKDVNYIFSCLHESSSLLEHLDTVDRYVIMCGQTHKLHEKILNIRNHIRHDLRDNLSQSSNKGRKQRARKLGIDERLLVHISFKEESIDVGKTSLKVSEIVEFMKYADELFKQHIKEAQAKGQIKGLAPIK